MRQSSQGDRKTELVSTSELTVSPVLAGHGPWRE